MSNLKNSDSDNGNVELLYRQIAKAINSSKKKVISVVNSEMVVLYWNIGKIIK